VWEQRPRARRDESRAVWSRSCRQDKEEMGSAQDVLVGKTRWAARGLRQRWTAVAGQHRAGGDGQKRGRRGRSVEEAWRGTEGEEAAQRSGVRWCAVEVRLFRRSWGGRRQRRAADAVQCRQEARRWASNTARCGP
jgi:hypothetical protein